MPSWVWTDVRISGPADVRQAFLEKETENDKIIPTVPENCTPHLHNHKEWLYINLGFDGWSGDSGYVTTNIVNILDADVEAICIHLETRWEPPLMMFDCLAAKYPSLQIYVSFRREDEDLAPSSNGWYKLPGTHYTRSALLHTDPYGCDGTNEIFLGLMYPIRVHNSTVSQLTNMTAECKEDGSIHLNLRDRGGNLLYIPINYAKAKQIQAVSGRPGNITWETAIQGKLIKTLYYNVIRLDSPDSPDYWSEIVLG